MYIFDKNKQLKQMNLHRFYVRKNNQFGIKQSQSKMYQKNYVSQTEKLRMNKAQ